MADDDGRALDSSTDALIGSTVVGKYRIDRLLGRGGMGAVYHATNVAIGKRVALKFLDRDYARDHDAATRFQREAEAASSVDSAHIVQIFDSGTTDDGFPFLVMELLQGEDLRARLRREGRVELADVVHIAGQVLRGLARAHEAEIVHRDLKPDNIYLCQRDDDPMFVKIVDFGISKVVRRATVDTLTRRGTVLGTAFYMSPEQAQAFRDVDGRADLYSLGAILYEALAGRPPHVGNTYEAVLIGICTTDAEDVRAHAAAVPEAVAGVITKALKRDRDQRFQSAREFYEALAAAAPGMLSSNHPRGSNEPIGSGARQTHDLGGRERRSANAAADARVATAGGTAVQPYAGDPGARRRTLVTAIVAALGAFALTVLLMANKAETPQPAQPEATQRALLPSLARQPTPRVTPTSQLEPIEAKKPERPPLGDAAGAQDKSETVAGKSERTRNAASKTAARAAASAPGALGAPGNGQPRASQPASEKGVAGGLELNTRGP